MKHVLRVVNVLATVIIVVAFLVLLRTVFTPSGQIPTIGGYGVMRTLTGSMEPEIPVHSLVVVKQEDPAQLQPGDIITFHSADSALDGSLNTHRIVDVYEQGGQLMFHTKGDANAAADADPVAASSVVGKVVFVSAGLGKVVSLFSNPLLFFPFIVVPLIILTVIEISKMVKSSKELAQAEEEQALRQAVRDLKAQRERRRDDAADADADDDDAADDDVAPGEKPGDGDASPR